MVVIFQICTFNSWGLSQLAGIRREFHSNLCRRGRWGAVTTLKHRVVRGCLGFNSWWRPQLSIFSIDNPPKSSTIYALRFLFLARIMQQIRIFYVKIKLTGVTMYFSTSTFFSFFFSFQKVYKKRINWIKQKRLVGKKRQNNYLSGEIKQMWFGLCG